MDLIFEAITSVYADLIVNYVMTQLKDGTTHQGAVTSMEPNEGTFVLHSETTKVCLLVA